MAQQPPAAELDDEQFRRIYGPWAPLTPTQLAELMLGFERPWWVVGGYAIEAFTGVRRLHDDIDMSIFVEDVPAFRQHLEPRYHLWSNAGGTFRFLDDAHPEPLEPRSQIWVREHAQAPWVIDCILSPSVEGMWQSKRDPSHVAPLEDVTWIGLDGVRYQRPEIVLLYKQGQERAKDRADLDEAWPLLMPDQRDWLTEAITRFRAARGDSRAFAPPTAADASAAGTALGP